MKPPKEAGLPDWECPRGKVDQDRFEKWTLEQLELLHGDDRDFQLRLAQMDENFANAWEADISSRLRAGRLTLAIKNQDVKQIVKLTKGDENLLQRSLQAMTKRRGRGRLAGEPRPRDIPPVKRALLEDASAEVDRIRQIWKHHYKHQNRGSTQDPSAEAIAARLYGLSLEDLLNFRRKHPLRRNLRLKSKI